MILTVSVPESSTPNHEPDSPFCITTCSSSKRITDKFSESTVTSSARKPRKDDEMVCTKVRSASASSVDTSESRVFFCLVGLPGVGLPDMVRD